MIFPRTRALIALTGLLALLPASVAHARPAAVSISGGDVIWGSGTGCTVGFNVHDRRGQPALLIAGRCGAWVTDWYADRALTQHIATTAPVEFPGNEAVLAVYDPGVAAPSTVNLHDGTFQTITGAGDRTVGDRITTAGSRSGVRTGTIIAVGLAVNTPEGTLTGLSQTDICREPRDDGDSLFDGTTALGLAIGLTGDCGTGGGFLFRPVTAVLAAAGARLP
ncbi:S1 family peptidase [Amycolatopsis sp. NPDC058986]|uniref:S1 family peptidase n=1 Tax=unclassified Amycolatopsis TaxID=2618356 RepID=UPI00367230E9